MRYLRATHRAFAIIIVIFTLYLSATGVLVQLVDMHSIITNAPATDPNVIAMREDFFGPPNFAVIEPVDFTAPPLPANADFGAMLARVLPSLRATAAGAPLRYVELRMMNGKPVGSADSKVGDQTEIMRADALTGTPLYHGIVPKEGHQPRSLRNQMKSLHRMDFLGDWSNPIEVVVELGLIYLIGSGIIIYYKLYKVRQRLKRSDLFWQGGGWWRTLHRSIALGSAIFLVIVTVSGGYLSVEGSYFRLQHYLESKRGPWVWGPGTDASTPLKDAELPAMLSTTLRAEAAALPGAPVKVIRLRYYGGMPQGLVIAGSGNETNQLVFNAVSGRRVSETEPGYPNTDLPLGWQGHQTGKNIHRGDLFALPGGFLIGRILATLTGLSLLYLSISGAVMYFEMWSKRRTAGRPKFFWS